MRPLYTANPIYDEVHWLQPVADEAVALGVGAEDYLGLPGVRLLGRAVSRSGLHRNLRRGDRAYLGIMAHCGTARCFPKLFLNEIVPVVMDCWEPRWDTWESIMRRLRVRTAVIMSRDSAEEMARRVDGLTTVWMPEGIKIERYRPGPPLAERSIDVLQIGRRFDPLHEAIAGPLADANRRYVFPDGGWVFPSFESMVAGLCDTRAFVCYPRCDTHPELAGRVETLTLRYLEGFATKTLVVGRAPKELVDLFGYDPVVPIPPDETAPRVLLEVLSNIEDHQDLVDRNHEAVHARGTWRHRVEAMLGELRALGYAPSSEVEKSEG